MSLYLHPILGALATARRSSMLLAVWMLLLLCLAASTAPLVAGQDCLSAQACFPWEMSGPSCRRGGLFNLRFMIDIAEENGWPASAAVKNYDAVYGFCPRVDQLQSFTLNSAPFLTSAYTTTKKVEEKEEEDGKEKEETVEETEYHLTNSLTVAYLSAFGFGNSNNTRYPEKGVSTGAVIIAQNGSTVCSSFNSVALVETLVLEVGLHKGVFNYVGSSPGGMRRVANPNYDPTLCGTHSSHSSADHSTTPPHPAAAKAAAAADTAGEAPADDASSSREIDYCNETIEVYVGPDFVQPLKTGFVPTCAVDSNGEDYCLFSTDPRVMCVGNPGQKNCARCYDNAQTISTSASLQIWTAYYGTDVNGNSLISGGSNPLNFRSFAGPGVLSDIGSKMKSLWHGNLSDVGLPTWPF